MDDREKLIRHGKRTISKAELEKLFGTQGDGELYRRIDALHGILSPIKASKTNGNLRYLLYLRYRIEVPPDDFGEEVREIATLHPLLQKSGYLQKKPAVYRQYRGEIRSLDRYLFQREEACEPISRKERSFEIFSREKQLDDSSFRKVLERLGMTREFLRYYDTPEYCFNDFIPERRTSMTLLICENKDIWFNLRRRMFEDRASTLFGVRVEGVVYGCGNRISERGALTSYTAFMGGSAIRYLYWGDIDRAGFNIYLGLLRANPDLQISLFLPAYERMLELARGRSMPLSDDHREIMDDYGDIYASVSPANRGFLAEQIRENRRIPQEIITYATLREEMR